MNNRQSIKFVKLARDKLVVNIKVNQVQSQGLLDMRSMVSILSRIGLEQNLPYSPISLVTKFTKSKEPLYLKAANNTDVSIDGVVVLKFTLESLNWEFDVPFLVTEQNVLNPIIGLNVIQFIFDNQYENLTLETISHTIQSLNIAQVDTFVKLIRETI